MEQEHPIDESFGEYLWCELCGYVYRKTAWAAANDTCPHCGAPLINARAWEEIVQRNPRYPSTPIEGKKYALFG